MSMSHIIDMTNHLPEAGNRTPIEKAGGSTLSIDDMVEAFGAEVWYYDAPPRRVSTANTLDTPGRRGVYVGRSTEEPHIQEFYKQESHAIRIPIRECCIYSACRAACATADREQLRGSTACA